MLGLCDNTEIVVSSSFFDIALLLKKYIFQNNLDDVKPVIFAVQNLVTMDRPLNKAWTMSEQDLQENVSDT